MVPLLNKFDVALLVEYVEEIDAIVEADDGTVFPNKVVELHDVVKEILGL